MQTNQRQPNKQPKNNQQPTNQQQGQTTQPTTDENQRKQLQSLAGHFAFLAVFGYFWLRDGK